MQATNLHKYAERLSDPAERRQALQALSEAANLPIELALVEQIEALYGAANGLTDVHSYCVDHLATHPARSDFEALMRAAFLVRVRVAFKQVDTADGPMFRRFDPLEPT